MVRKVAKEMVLLRIILSFVLVLPTLNAVKVDLKGSLSLGKEVVDALRTFADKYHLNARRAGGPGIVQETETDAVSLIVHSAFICRQIEFCKGDLGKLVSDYVISITKSFEDVFSEYIKDADRNENEGTLKAVVFEKQLKQLLKFVKKILFSANQKITEDNEAFTWVDLLKRMNAKFIDTALIFAAQKLQGNVEEITVVKTKITQKLVVAGTFVELQFINRICLKKQICPKSFEATKALNAILNQLITIPDHRAKEFVRHFYESLPDTNFYYRISDVTAHEFQTILHDMAFADNIPTKNVLSIVQKIVEERLNATENSANFFLNAKSGRDVTLVHGILSDLDHFYSKLKKEPFYDFLADFFLWTKNGGKFRGNLRRMMKDIQNSIASESDELVYKLVNEVKVFMEITVDPDP